MAQSSFVTPELNLLPEDDLESKPGGHFLKWALSWGKKIVILTELLVVLAFLSRFKFDSDVANLSEEIDRRKTIIEASQSFENQFRSVQDRINKVKQVENLASTVTIYDELKSLIPVGIDVKQITIANRQMSIQGNGEDQLLTVMVAALKSSPDFAYVTLEKVSKESTGNQVKFSLTAYYIAQKT